MIKPLKHAGIMPEGDCGACCVGALAGISVKNVYEIYGKEICLPYHAILTTIQKLAMEYENFLPSYSMINTKVDWFPFGQPAYQNWMAWFDLSLNRTNKGLVGISHVNLHGKGNVDPYVDHYVLITTKDNGNKDIDKIVVVECPTNGGFEISAKDFLLKYGGYNTIWVKPK